jgi:hypothetical protein
MAAGQREIALDGFDCAEVTDPGPNKDGGAVGATGSAGRATSWGWRLSLRPRAGPAGT